MFPVSFVLMAALLIIPGQKQKKIDDLLSLYEKLVEPFENLEYGIEEDQDLPCIWGEIEGVSIHCYWVAQKSSLSDGKLSIDYGDGNEFNSDRRLLLSKRQFQLAEGSESENLKMMTNSKANEVFKLSDNSSNFGVNIFTDEITEALIRLLREQESIEITGFGLKIKGLETPDSEESSEIKRIQEILKIGVLIYKNALEVEKEQ